MPKSVEIRSVKVQHEYRQMQGMIACNNHNMRNPISLHLVNTHNRKMSGGVTLRLLHAHPLPLPSCCSIFIMPSSLSLVHGIVIPTSFNILEKCFFTLVLLCCNSISPCKPHPFWSSRSREITRAYIVIRKWCSCIQKYMYS